MTPGDIPGPMSGSHPLASWLNKLRRAVIVRTPRPGLGFRLREETNGFTLQVLPGQGGQPGQATESIERFRLKSIAANHLVCRTWDGTTEGTTDTFVAKPTKLRESIENEFIDARLILYTYPSHTERVAASSGLADEQQNIVPRYLTPYATIILGANYIHLGDEIFAVRLPVALFSVSSIPVYYLDMNVDGRAWAKKYGT